MTPTRARRLAGWLSFVALAGYWLALMNEQALDELEEHLGELERLNEELQVELAVASRAAAEDDA